MSRLARPRGGIVDKTAAIVECRLHTWAEDDEVWIGIFTLIGFTMGMYTAVARGGGKWYNEFVWLIDFVAGFNKGYYELLRDLNIL